MDSLATMDKVLQETQRIVNGIEPSQLDNPTPCDEWTVRDVLNHVTSGAKMFTISAELGSVPDDQLIELMTGDSLGDDYRAAFHEAADNAIVAFSAPGVLDKMVVLPFGEMPGALALSIAVFDVLTHAVDVAASTGQHIADTELLETALVMGEQMVTPELRVPGVFDPAQPVAADAPAETRLLAFAGRKV